MNHDASKRQRKRLRNDISALEAVEQDIQQTQAELAKIRAALANLRNERIEVKAELRNLYKRRDVLKTSITSRERRLGTMSTFPAELLSRIFTAAATIDDDVTTDIPRLPEGELGIDFDSKVLPFRIAAVNRHWRNVALNNSRTWAYIALQPAATQSKRLAQHNYLVCVLKRSDPAPVNVTICLGCTTRSTEEEDYLAAALTRLSKIVLRIRVLALDSRICDQSSLKHMLVILQCPTPALQRLSVSLPSAELGHVYHGFPEEYLPVVLPEAPLLQSISFRNAPGIFCPHAGLPALRSFSFASSIAVYSELIMHTLFQSPRLDTVFIKSQDNLFSGPRPVVPARLAIKALELQDIGYELLVDASFPTLHTLTISSYGVATLSGISSFAGVLTTLHMTAAFFNDTILSILTQLDALECAELSAEDDNDIPVDFRALFDALCDAADPMWPRLQHLTLRNMLRDDPEYDGSGLVRLVRARNIEGNPNVLPLMSVKFGRSSIKDWIAMQVKQIMGDKCVMFN